MSRDWEVYIDGLGWLDRDDIPTRQETDADERETRS